MRTYDEWLTNTTMTVREYFEALGVVMGPEELYSTFGKIYDEVSANGLAPIMYDDAAEALEHLLGSQKQLFVLSSHPIPNLEKEAKRYGLFDMFTHMWGDSRNKALDLKALLNTFEISPQEAVYVGDMIFDVKAAKQAGITPIAVATGYHTKEMLAAEKPHTILSRLSELKDHSLFR